MRKSVFFLSLVLVFSACGCSGDSEKTEQKIEKKEHVSGVQTKAPKKEITVEKYCQMQSERAALLMDKYYEKLKGKEYSEIKDLYEELDKDDKEILEKYGTDSQGAYSFFRDNVKEVMDYKDQHPEHDVSKKYPNFSEGKKMLADLAFAKYKSGH